MRSDQRTPDALRPVSIERHYVKHAPGAVLVAFGDTKVVCTATYDPRLPAWLKAGGQGWLTAEYAMLPAATQTRGSRDAVKKGRALEISRLIGRSLRSVVDLVAVGECQITIDCDVIQADGGTRTAAITGAYVALHDALHWAVEQGNIARMPLLTTCAAVSVGMVKGTPMLDLNYEEDACAEVDMNVVMNGRGELIEVQGTAEKKPFQRETLLKLLDLGQQGIAELTRIQQAVLKDP
ncbi:MAG: ribonuclease PH [Candidatus Hydrogenedentes bacterium]|nr:ribonuclease PH [Candidatus Hydrogenedentota bacterium]